MIELLQQQYALQRGAREILFDFIETGLGEALNRPLPAYENKSIRYLLEHNAGCYFYWLAHFALGQPNEQLYIHEQDYSTVSLIRQLYNRVDDAVALFFKTYKDRWEVPNIHTYENEGQESATPLQLFTQVLTHESHHKGQIVLMCRLWGYTPPDTDVRLIFLVSG